MTDTHTKPGHIGEVIAALNRRLTERGSRRANGPTQLRLSSAGTCARQLAYKIHNWQDATPYDSRAISNFALGDTIHDVERAHIRSVAPLHSEEKAVTFVVDPEPIYPRWGWDERTQQMYVKETGPLEVVGHIDGILDLQDGPMLIDIKSASSFGFEEAERNGASYEYTAQLNAYMEATGIKRAALWMFNKNNGVRQIIPVQYKPELVAAIKQRFMKAATSSLGLMPKREHAPEVEMSRKQPTGYERLPWNCKYCSFVQVCWEGEGFKRELMSGDTYQWRRPLAK